MLIAAFDHKAAEIEQQNSQALLDIQAASQKLEALRRDQAQATSQLATSRQTMAKLPASDAQHPELQNSIQSLEQKQQARAAEISAQAQALQRLNDAQKQEAAQHRLRREQSAFIVRSMRRWRDRGWRYSLLFGEGLAACTRGRSRPTR
jgi:chromosome segregation ATPase